MSFKNYLCSIYYVLLILLIVCFIALIDVSADDEVVFNDYHVLFIGDEAFPSEAGYIYSLNINVTIHTFDCVFDGYCTLEEYQLIVDTLCLDYAFVNNLSFDSYSMVDGYCRGEIIG